jgi:fructuronate reductase
MRLSSATLGHLQGDLHRPAYDRAALTTGIVHLGLGAFSRCHLAEFTEDLLDETNGPWGIAAINLRPPALEPMLDPQDRLYLRELRDGSDRDRRVIGALKEVLTIHDAATLSKALALCTDPKIQVVTMTVTEKGYCHIPATGQLDPEHPDIRHDIRHPAEPRSLPGLILETIRRARLSGLRPPAFLSCDNVPGNGATLRRCVQTLAKITGLVDAAWIEGNVAFPDTMVDRIVPATTQSERDELLARSGIEDHAMVVGEPFRMWVIEDDPRAQLPPWNDAGAILTRNVGAYETIKMRVLNGLQTGLVHLANMAGHPTTAAMMADPVFLAFGQRVMSAEVRPGLPQVEGIDHQAYIAQSVRRLTNTALHHTTAQIATDGSRKIRQRLLDPLGDALRTGRPAGGLEIEVAGWIEHVTRFSLSDMGITDPMLANVQTILGRTGSDTRATVEAILRIDAIFPAALVALPGFADRIVALVGAIRDRGPRPVMAAFLETS